MKGIYHPSPDDRVTQGVREGKQTKTEKRKDQEEISSGLYQIMTPNGVGRTRILFVSFSMENGNAGGYPVKRRCAN
jgi:hypothetical protein